MPQSHHSCVTESDWKMCTWLNWPNSRQYIGLL